MAPRGRRPRVPPSENNTVQDDNSEVLAAAATRFFQRMVNGDMVVGRTTQVGCTLEQFSHQHPPTFDGRLNSLDAESWIERMEQIFEVLYCTDDQKVKYATYHLTDMANKWWKSTRALVQLELGEAVPISWEHFKRIFLDHFFPRTLQESRARQFMDLTQGSMTAHLGSLHLGAAFGLAKIQEEYVLSSRRSWNQNVTFGDKLPTDNVVDATSKVQRNTALVRKVTSFQMDEKRKKGLCYHCDEKSNPSHVCKNSTVYLLQMDNSAEDEVLQNVVGELVPKAKGVDEGRSKELKISSFSVEILVDSGSTHNFLDPLVLEATNLKVVNDVGLQVKVANGA
ncbi:uncharacterized protein LOC108988431 [Juglans regia]|uniref:Uncharacterized protein LOC108988431 n=2 Tax=Juglans regia TaxID=51240 RepID=A0A6P9ECF7_JUGRE|nr:uncharacterized protein LOC108988431 [Juglans regia]